MVGHAQTTWAGNEPSVQSLDFRPHDGRSPGAGPACAAAHAAGGFHCLPAGGAAAAPALTITFTGDSWVRILAADNQQVSGTGLLAAGQQRSYSVGEVGRSAWQRQGRGSEARGRCVDLEPFSRANVARFTLSSDGSLAPVAN
jgi:cytoskeleton protein RodZ